MVGGATLTGLLGTSAWYAPGLSAAVMVRAIATDSKAVMPICAALNGEYGMKDLHLGVPAVLGKNGVEKIIELDLNEEEMEMLRVSADHVRSVMKTLDDMNFFSVKYGK
jgi:malate dehydrogenase